MKKCRIVKFTYPDGRVEFAIQQKHHLFFWWWVDAWVNSSSGASCTDTFSTYEEAESNLWKFDGSKSKTEVVLIKN